MGAFSGFSGAAGGSNNKSDNSNNNSDSDSLHEEFKQRRKQAAEDSSRGPALASYHKGGRVRKTGKARLKKGELVLTKKQAKAYKKRLRSK